MVVFSSCFVLMYLLFTWVNVFPNSECLRTNSSFNDYEIVNVTIGIEISVNSIRTGIVHYFGFPFPVNNKVYESRVANLSFSAFGKSYEIVFERNQTPAFFPEAVLYMNETSNFSFQAIKNLDFQVLEGHMNHDNKTKVYGYVVNHTFSGAIVSWNSTMVLEPAWRFNQLNNKTYGPGETVVFRSKDVNPEFYGDESDKDENAPDISSNTSNICKRSENGVIICSGGMWQEESVDRTEEVVHNAPQSTYEEESDFMHIKNRHSQLETSSSDMLCLVEVIADYPFFSNMGKDIASAVAEMVYYVKMADAVLKDVNFGSENQSAVYVRFSVKDAAVLTSPSEENNTETDSLVAYLERLGSRHQNYCLSIVFSGNKNLRDQLAGFTPDGGGICATQNNDTSPLKRNVGIVRVVDSSGVIQPSIMNSLLTGYLIRLSMGSAHENSSCPHREVTKSHAMLLTDLDDWMIRTKWFPQCSRETVLKILQQHRDNCLTPIKGVCGNGIVEMFEECDCGMTKECYSNSSCCTPHGGKGSDPGCILRRGMDKECDSSKPCCSENCHIIPDNEQHFCAKEGDEECNPRFCDGISPECPQVPMKKNGALCGRSHATCSFGYCNSTVCQDQGLKDCDCEAEYECHICCVTKEGKCETFAHTSPEKPYFKPFGVSCSNEYGMCNESGQCLMLFWRSSQNRIIGFLVFDYIMACVAVFVTKYLQRPV